MKVLKYGSTLTKKEFNDFLKKLFAPPKKRSVEHLWYAGRWWRWRAGIKGSLMVKPDGKLRYRQATEWENTIIELVFALQAKSKNDPMQPDPRQLNIFHLATETRDESYHALVTDLGDRQKKVFEILRRGDRSNSAIAYALGWPINRVTGRVKELRDLTLVFPAGVMVDPITLRRVQVWTADKSRQKVSP
jgi:hypothetical protein